jgi:signal transduction histidine kinase
MRGKSGRIRNELIVGLIAIIFLSAAVSCVGILVWSRFNFDALVQKSDIEVARSIAERIEPYYAAHGSWAGIESEIEKLKSTVLRQNFQSEQDTGERHTRDGGIPLVITDLQGVPVFPAKQSGASVAAGNDLHQEKRLDRFKISDGVAVTDGGRTVGYVFFKSMLKRSYNPHEEAFIASLAVTIGISVLVGVILAIFAGSFLASRFVRPILGLDDAVQRIAKGESGVRAAKVRNDEVGRLAENFNAMAQRIEMTESARRNLLADIAHELRTPVSVIQANLEMIIDGVYSADRERLESLYGETRLLADLIGSLREISDLETGVVSMNLQPVRLYPLLVETRVKYLPLFDEREIALSLEPFKHESLCVLSDENRLRQVIRNVIVNALKYSQSKTTVTVSCEQISLGAEPFLRVKIADEGPGVPGADLEKIFERFYRVDSSRNRDSGGRGLGLAICRQFVEASGGKIYAKNRVPHGLGIVIELPICAG